ncbi:hypothetical protein pEaSNUABM37_00161 [Erwinia phage pEa_SNUABM_37]|nr:hypothetical protein pEaSNUABM37_00161 [Erwinia phage pEa_SNUABM_37]QXO10631.1 hypothetical protein pEaSNUABM48_00161 [Erwinia phage pEa_SNUABM_48]
MRFLKRFFLTRLLTSLEVARRDNYKTEDGLRALTALRKVINSDNPIEYFSVRKMLDVRMRVQTHCATNLLITLTEINEALSDESTSLPEPRIIYRLLQENRDMTLYDWLVDEDNNVLDIPEFYVAFTHQLNVLCDLVFQVDDIDRDYILRKLTPLYTELLVVFAATLDCGLRSI